MATKNTKPIRTIIADPPWSEQGGGKIKRGADRHYPLLTTDEIVAVLKSTIESYKNADDQHMYLWVTNNFLVDGLFVLDQLGFDYKTNLVWVKPSFGLGQYFRGQHEICLFAIKGRGFNEDLRTPNNDIASVILAPKREHSRKPREFYDLVKRRSYGPYLEIFARTQPKPNWFVEGFDIGLFENGQKPIN